MQSLNDNAVEILISPFGDLWTSLHKQSEAWETVNTSLSTISEINQIFINAASGKTVPITSLLQEKLSALVSPLANRARDLLQNTPEVLVYPSFVGAWALAEAAFEDMIASILVSDPKSISILENSRIRPKQELEPRSQEWALDTIKRIESKVRVPGSVVKTHKAILALFDIPLAYPESYAELIEEMNQVRNCILHRNGSIDEKSASICPRLKQFIGKKMDSSDPLFKVYGVMLADYTFAWLRAVIQGPYLREGLKAEAKIPPTFTSDYGRLNSKKSDGSPIL